MDSWFLPLASLHAESILVDISVASFSCFVVLFAAVAYSLALLRGVHSDASLGLCSCVAALCAVGGAAAHIVSGGAPGGSGSWQYGAAGALAPIVATLLPHKPLAATLVLGGVMAEAVWTAVGGTAAAVYVSFAALALSCAGALTQSLQLPPLLRALLPNVVLCFLYLASPVPTAQPAYIAAGVAITAVALGSVLCASKVALVALALLPAVVSLAQQNAHAGSACLAAAAAATCLIRSGRPDGAGLKSGAAPASRLPASIWEAAILVLPVVLAASLADAGASGLPASVAGRALAVGVGALAAATLMGLAVEGALVWTPADAPQQRAMLFDVAAIIVYLGFPATLVCYLSTGSIFWFQALLPIISASGLPAAAAALIPPAVAPYLELVVAGACALLYTAVVAELNRAAPKAGLWAFLRGAVRYDLLDTVNAVNA